VTPTSQSAFGLYVHIPYCDSKCPYCDFNSHVVARWPEAAYSDALCRELGERAGSDSWSGREIATIFFGGGTPSLFEPASIGRILECARRLWPLSADAEISLEANPGTVDRDRLAGFRDAGINRVSFGVQSFQERHLKTLGRIHSAAQAECALDDARLAGFDNVNLDLIFALPGQTLAEWNDDLARATAIGTTHISAYNLTYEEGTPFHRWRRQGRLRPLDEESELAMFEQTRRFLAERSFAPYEISNFARDGFACRHNLNYWRSGDYLGVGAGAHSFCVSAAQPFGRRWANLRGPGAYIQRITTNGEAEASAETLDRRQACGEFVFLHLRCANGFAAATFTERFGAAFEEEFAHVADLQGEGLVDANRGRWQLTPKGLLLADSVFATFL